MVDNSISSKLPAALEIFLIHMQDSINKKHQDSATSLLGKLSLIQDKFSSDGDFLGDVEELKEAVSKSKAQIEKEGLPAVRSLIQLIKYAIVGMDICNAADNLFKEAVSKNELYKLELMMRLSTKLEEAASSGKSVEVSDVSKILEEAIEGLRVSIAQRDAQFASTLGKLCQVIVSGTELKSRDLYRLEFKKDCDCDDCKIIDSVQNNAEFRLAINELFEENK